MERGEGRGRERETRERILCRFFRVHTNVTLWHLAFYTTGPLNGANILFSPPTSSLVYVLLFSDLLVAICEHNLISKVVV